MSLKTPGRQVFFYCGQAVQGTIVGVLLAIALWRLLALSGSIPVFRYLMF